MKILSLTYLNLDEIHKQTNAVLKEGGLIIYPTETVYGIGADAMNPKAVEKLLQYKSRREGKPLSIAVTDLKMAEKFVTLTDQAKEFYSRFLPGPYTVVSQGKHTVAPGVESEFGTLGIRIPNHPLILEIVKQFGGPITSTSANASDKKRPYAVQDILDNLSEKQKSLIGLIIDAGTLPPNEPSVVVDMTLSTPLTVRGNLTEKEIVGSTLPAQTFTTNSDQETRDLAGKLILKYWNTIKSKGLVVGLNGELGTGKTIFTQGIAKFLQITEPLTSPTYTYMNEYAFNRHAVKGKLFHLDVWKVDSPEAFALLKVPSLVKPNHLIVIEWWQQVAAYWPEEVPVALHVSLEETGETSRKIVVQEA